MIDSYRGMLQNNIMNDENEIVKKLDRIIELLEQLTKPMAFFGNPSDMAERMFRSMIPVEGDEKKN